MAQSLDISKDLRKLLAFGSGVGIEIRARDLEIVIARVRPGKVHVLGRLVVEDYASRPAAEWGVEYARFLKGAGVTRLSATVLLPRREVIVRHLALPGVTAGDIDGAIRFQIDTLHPYGEEEVAWGWSPLGFGAVLVGIARREAVERYNTLFVEAGIAVAGFTFSAAAVHAAVRLNGMPPGGFVALSRTATGAVEVYGESPARPIFSAEFDLAPQRAASIALGELRLPPATAPKTLEEILPKPRVNPVTHDVSRNALPYAAALAGACPRLTPAANVLPLEHRRSNSRAVFVPTAILATLVLLIAIGTLVYSSWSDKQYLKKINSEIARLEPDRKKAEALDKQTNLLRARAVLLDEFRKQTRNDLDALNELTHLIEPPAWTNLVDINRDNIRLGGEAPQASPLLKILDGSPLFERSETLVVTKGQSGEGFQIRTGRRQGK